MKKILPTCVDNELTGSSDCLNSFVRDFTQIENEDSELPHSLPEILKGCKSLLDNECYESAETILVIALNKWSANGSLHGVLADCYCKSDRFSEAAFHYENVFKYSQKIPVWAIVGYANVQEKIGNYEKASTLLADALEEEFSFELAWRSIQLSTSSAATGHVVQSIMAHKDAMVDSLESSARDLRLLGDFLMKLGEYSLGFELFTASHELDKNATLPITRKLKHLIKNNLVDQASFLVASWKESLPGDERLKRFEAICLNSTIANTVRTIAFYLPQYHPIPENDEWWGEGFTEWRNVAAAKSMWNGHSQPRLPTANGYYDLRLPEVYDKQTTLAEEYGINGFCFYYYWFNGRKILEKPLQNILDKKTKPFPFCICWVNEDWTRSWDGMTGEVLLSTTHTLEMNLRFIEDVYPVISNEDYIRIEGKPLLIVYCAEKLDKTNQTTNAWREYCRSQGLGEIYICAVQSFGFGDPTELGYDAALEFPPHAIPKSKDKPEGSHVEVLRVDGLVDDFNGKVYSYQEFADCAIARPKEKYNLHRTCMLAWDNTARRGKQAHVYGHFSVEKYQQWLQTNMRKALVEQTDPVVFVNAWNEWAEGSTLEPDADYGYELLGASRRAKRVALWNNESTYWRNNVCKPLIDEISGNESIIMVGHDAHKNGAQINFLYMLQNLVRQKKKRVVVILKEGGELVSQYEQYGKVYILSDFENRSEIFKSIVKDYQAKGANKAICNTCVTGDLTEILHESGYNVVSLIHELPSLIEQYNLAENCRTLSKYSNSIVFASDYVAEKFLEKIKTSQSKVHIYSQGIRSNTFLESAGIVREEVRREFNIPTQSKVVIGCGYGDIRKGIDLFVQLASIVVRDNPETYFIWIGDIDQSIRSYLQRDINQLPDGKLIVTGFREDVGRILIGGDIFALTSREDPFPSVLMEAMNAGLAVFGFADCGGYHSIVDDSSGGIVQFGDLDNYSIKIKDLLTNDDKLSAISQRNSGVAKEKFGYTSYINRLLELCQKGFVDSDISSDLKISVIVPNYNYAQYLRLRLKTVFEQSKFPDEVIVLDDASTDRSLEIISEFESKYATKIKIIQNETNSGNLFLQWKKGIEEASGDLIWIAEADDYCDHDFLRRMSSELQDERVSIAFCNSIMVDEFGCSHGATYKEYYATQFGDYFESSFKAEGSVFVNNVMSRRNAVMNASAVLFRKSMAAEAIDGLGNLNISGDWLFWIDLCMKGAVSYIDAPYNYHRRHRKSVVGRALQEKSKVVIEMIQVITELKKRHSESISEEALIAALDSIENTYEELFGSLPGSAPIESDDLLSEQYLGLVSLLDLQRDHSSGSTVLPSQLTGKMRLASS